jgi:hypothetical protein
VGPGCQRKKEEKERGAGGLGPGKEKVSWAVWGKERRKERPPGLGRVGERREPAGLGRNKEKKVEKKRKREVGRAQLGNEREKEMHSNAFEFEFEI